MKKIANKENLKKSIFILLSYVIFMISNNLNTMLKKVMFESSDKINFVNITIIISTLIMTLIIIFKKSLFKRKINFWVIFCTLIFYNLAEGYFYDFVSFPFIILYIYLLLMTFCGILKFKKSFEISMVTSFSILILSAFVVGLFGLLIIFKYIMILFSILMIIYIVKNYKKDKESITLSLDKLFDSGFIIFNILWIIAMFGGAGIYVHAWDEYSHWAYDAKATIYYSKFGTSQEIMLKTRGYAPIFTTWHYIVSMFTGFNEHNLYVGLNMLISIYLLPAFYYIKNNNIITKVLAFISIVFCCYLFGSVYSYNSLYVDLAITSIFSSAIILYYISIDNKEKLNLPIILVLIILTLSKTNGFVIGFTAVLIIFINEIMGKKQITIKKFFKSIIEFIKKYKFYILAIIITFFAWKLYLFITSKITTDYYDFTLLPDVLKGDLKYKLNYTFVVDFIKNVYKSFDEYLVSGLFKLSLYQYVMALFILIIIIFSIDTKDIKKGTKKALPFIFAYIAFFAITVLSMFVAMSKYEASILASFGRYLNWFHLGILIFAISYVLKTNEKGKFLFKIIFLSYIVLSIPFCDITYFIKNPVRSESYNVSSERTKKVELINKYTPKETLIYVIDQKETDGIMAMWYTRYYSFPRKNNASSSIIGWKIKTKNNIDDLQDWGFTAETWEKHLIKYKFKYVFLYTADDEFFNETSFMYDDINIAKKSTLFKIETEWENVKLIPIK